MAEPDIAQLAELYRDHAPALLGYLRRRFGWVDSPEDLLQETFVKAARSLDALERPESARAWLFTIAHRVGVTAARKRRRDTAPLTEQTVAAPPDDARLVAMRQAIDELPEAHRRPLELRLRERLTYAEIAEALGLPIGTVRSRLHHAVGRLRDMLKDTDDAH